MRDRAATYDKPEGERSMAQTVAVFNQFHGTALTEAQGWHLLQILKDVRLFARAGYHADSAEDCTAYSALKAEAMSTQAGTQRTVADLAADLRAAGLAASRRMHDAEVCCAKFATCERPCTPRGIHIAESGAN